MPSRWIDSGVSSGGRDRGRVLHPAGHHVRVGDQGKLQESYPARRGHGASRGIAAAVGGRLAPQAVERDAAMHHAQPVQFGHRAGAGHKKRPRLRDWQRTAGGELCSERRAHDVLADDEALRSALLEGPGAARHRVARLVGRARPLHDVGPDLELPAERRIEQHQADTAARGLVTGPQERSLRAARLETFQEPIVAEKKWAPVTANEPAGLPDREHLPPYQPFRQQFRHGRAADAGRQAVATELASQAFDLVVVGEPGVGDELPEFLGGWHRHRLHPRHASSSPILMGFVPAVPRGPGL